MDHATKETLIAANRALLEQQAIRKRAAELDLERRESPKASTNEIMYVLIKSNHY